MSLASTKSEYCLTIEAKNDGMTLEPRYINYYLILLDFITAFDIIIIIFLNLELIQQLKNIMKHVVLEVIDQLHIKKVFQTIQMFNLVMKELHLRNH